MADRLYGRDQLVDALTRSEAPLTLLTGDSGVGKTRILEEAAALTRTAWISAPPRQLFLSDGAVQQGIVDGLGHVAAEVTAERGAARELGERMAAATEGFAKEQMQDLVRALGAELLEIVRGRLGPKFGHALADYVRQLRSQMGEGLASRLAAMADESAAEALASIAGEVVAFAGDRRIALHLDAGERLSEREWRTLADLALRFPERAHVRVAFAGDLVSHEDESHSSCVKIRRDLLPELLRVAVGADEVGHEDSGFEPLGLAVGFKCGS